VALLYLYSVYSLTVSTILLEQPSAVFVIQVVSKMFVWFEMKKTSALPPEDSFPSIELYPCVYKKR